MCQVALRDIHTLVHKAGKKIYREFKYESLSDFFAPRRFSMFFLTYGIQHYPIQGKA